MDQPITPDPHGNQPRSTVLSVAKLFIILFDFWLGHLGPWRTIKRRGVVVLERGWYDQVVDPRRYRLSPTVEPLARLLGRLVPRADCVVVAGGSADAIYERRAEISHEEVARQLSAWRVVAPLAARVVIMCDTTRSERVWCPETIVQALVPVQPRRDARCFGAGRSRRHV